MIPVVLGSATDRLSKRVQKLLEKRQSKAMDHEPSQIDPWASFRATKAGAEVAEVLSGLFHCKCAYCEQEAAKDIEHFFPKSRYRQKMFLWDNFLWCCKNCNTEKLAVFPLDAAGNAVLLNPTVDEPLDYFAWDEISGQIVPHSEPSRGFRATQTRDRLGLDQFSLAEERRNKLANVRYLLARVANEEPVAQDTISRLHDELAPHRPWLGIVRQFFRRSTDSGKLLIDAARAKLPQIDHWIESWLD